MKIIYSLSNDLVIVFWGSVQIFNHLCDKISSFVTPYKVKVTGKMKFFEGHEAFR